MDTMQRRIDTPADHDSPADRDSPPSLVTDRFGSPASPDELRLAVEAHCATAPETTPGTARGTDEQSVREFRLAAQRLVEGGPVPSDG